MAPTPRLGRLAVGVTASAVACALLAACGTTAPRESAAGSGSSVAAQSGLGVAGTSQGGATAERSSTTVTTGSTADTASTGSGSSVPVAVANEQPSPARSANGGRTNATTRAPYKVGLPYSTTDQAALTAMGGRGSLGDMQGEGQAVIDWLNARGGIGGRTVMPVWFDENAGEQPDQIATEGCTTWIDDNHVDAALPGGPNVDMDGLRSCLGKAGIPAVSIQWHVQSRQKDLAASPLWVEPFALSMESFAKTYVDNLAAQHFFDRGRVGILYDDGPKWTAVEKAVLEPELRRVGAEVVARASYGIRGFGDVAPSEPALRSYVAQFKAQKVDRVISFEPWEGWGFFMMEADRQGFEPRWGLSSQTDWNVAYATGLVPEAQMKDAQYVGWSPVMDLKGMDRSGAGQRWPRLRECDSIYDTAGLKRDGALAEVFALALCDGLLDLADLGAVARSKLDRTTFRRSVDDVAWQSALMPGMKLSTARTYGVTEVRPARWLTSSSEFVYTGPPTAAAP
jgi:hypothetical protein